MYSKYSVKHALTGCWRASPVGCTNSVTTELTVTPTDLQPTPFGSGAMTRFSGLWDPTKIKVSRHVSTYLSTDLLSRTTLNFHLLPSTTTTSSQPPFRLRGVAGAIDVNSFSSSFLKSRFLLRPLPQSISCSFLLACKQASDYLRRSRIDTCPLRISLLPTASIFFSEVGGPYFFGDNSCRLPRRDTSPAGLYYREAEPITADRDRRHGFCGGLYIADRLSFRWRRFEQEILPTSHHGGT